MRYVYLCLGILSIFIITIFTFKEDTVYYYYAKYNVKKEAKVKENKYFYEDNFYYVDNYKDLEIHNKKELYDSVYYIVNSGTIHTKRYFDIDYKDFEKDYNELFLNEEKLNIINNFVHPYNSFISIEANLKGYVMEIKVNHNKTYNEDNIKIIDNKVDSLIKELVKDKMNEEEKIKVIHDYIVENTTYDEDFCVLDNQKECTTTSKYASDNAYGVLKDHYGICSGYTDLIAIFLNKLNIVNYRITNDTHTWNAVNINNNWYHLDATWDDPIGEQDTLSDTYFLITTKEDSQLEESHTFNKEIFVELN